VSTDDDRVMLSVRVPPQLKAYVDVDERSNQEIVEAALWREFGGEKQARIDRRVDEINRRISNVESEKNDRERELAELQEERERMLEAKERTDDARRKYAECRATGRSERACIVYPNAGVWYIGIAEKPAGRACDGASAGIESNRRAAAV